jgi:hypothetical protein
MRQNQSSNCKSGYAYLARPVSDHHHHNNRQMQQILLSSHNCIKQRKQKETKMQTPLVVLSARLLAAHGAQYGLQRVGTPGSTTLTQPKNKLDRPFIVDKDFNG